MASEKRMEFRLKEACQLTDSLWAAWLEKDSERWGIRAACRLAGKERSALSELTLHPKIKTWLANAIGRNEDRSRQIPPLLNSLGNRMYAFPDQITQRVLLVGAGELSAASRRYWHDLALGSASRMELPAVPPHAIDSSELAIPYYYPQALDQILAHVLKSVNCQGGWLAIRTGDQFEVKCAASCPEVGGERIPIEANPLLRELLRKRLPRQVSKGQLDWAMVPRAGLQSGARSWVALPLVIGKRLIGMIALWGEEKFPSSTLETLRQTSSRVAPAVEGSITFTDLTSHLQRMAMLNDFAITVSSALDLEQIAQRVFALLKRAFETERIIFYILSPDEGTLYHYLQGEKKIILKTISMEGEQAEWPLQKGEILRADHISPEGAYTPVYPESRSALLVPLKYRGQLIGALGLESLQEAGFSLYDEHLLVVIGSHLSGLIENSRLRQEAEVRARNLALVHDVVEHVIGLTDVHQVAQITSELLARNFAFELAVVMLFDHLGGELKLEGIGGSAAEVVRDGLQKMDIQSRSGITGRVATTGQNMRVSDVDQDPVYIPIPNWKAGSEMCVALKDAGEILGVIDVESHQKNAYTQNDYLVLEALAGILASVISNVSAYQKLQATVEQLQSAREELQERIAAQRIAESRLVQAAKMVAVGEMAAGIAHELNNPLTTVSGFVELVMDELPKKTTVHDDLELVLKEANRAKSVVRRLLDFARQSESVRVRTDMNEIVTDVLALVNHLLQISNIQILTALEDGLPWVSVDRNQIKQIILNLIHNALHAMPKGGQLYITTDRQKRDHKDWLVTHVRDTGSGITPENLKRVFEPFFTTRSKEGGTGLGLSVSYGIAVDHGGFLEVESKVGKGSTFSIWLPIEKE